MPHAARPDLQHVQLKLLVLAGLVVDHVQRRGRLKIEISEVEYRVGIHLAKPAA